MNIFESLENLNVSEECFHSIVTLVEKHLKKEEQEDLDKYTEKKKCKWCEDEYPSYEINKEGHCDTCQRAIDSRT
jgi:hypothetical protein